MTTTKKWKVPKEPLAAQKLSELKRVFGEKTDSRTIIRAIIFCHGRVFEKIPRCTMKFTPTSKSP